MSKRPYIFTISSETLCRVRY